MSILKQVTTELIMPVVAHSDITEAAKSCNSTWSKEQVMIGNSTSDEYEFYTITSPDLGYSSNLTARLNGIRHLYRNG